MSPASAFRRVPFSLATGICLNLLFCLSASSFGAGDDGLPLDLKPGRGAVVIPVASVDSQGTLSAVTLPVNIWLDGNFLNLSVGFPAEKELRAHHKWHWSVEKRIYVPGDEQEQSLAVLWSRSRDSFSQADAWVWRAARSDPAGWADDMGCRPEGLGSVALSPQEAVKRLVYDHGRLCWYTRMPSSFAGETLPRFFSRAPTGSCADVLASGHWSKGDWTVLMRRKLDTRHDEDDISFMPGERYYFSCLLGEGSTNWRQLGIFSIEIPVQPQTEPDKK